jgi:MAC/Perforin domain
MKKFILSCTTALLLFSCTQEPEFLETVETSVSKGDVTAPSSLMRAGDAIYDVLGAGYNICGDYANANSAGFQVIDIPKFKAEKPDRFYEEFPYSLTFKEEFGDNALSYSRNITRKIDANTGFFGFSGSLDFTNATTHKYDSRNIYASNNLTIRHKRLRFNATAEILSNYLTQEFTQDLLTKTPAQIVADYGTHVALDIYTGAKLEILTSAQTTSDDRSYAARTLIKAGFLGVFNGTISNEVNTTDNNKNFDKRLYYQTRGGNPALGLNGEINLEQGTVPRINYSAWQNSSGRENAVLIDFGSNNALMPIYDLIVDANKKAAVRAYVEAYLNENKTSLSYTNTFNFRNSYLAKEVSTGKLFTFMNGKLREVLSWNTFQWLFVDYQIHTNNITTSQRFSVEQGAPIGIDSGFLKVPSTGAIYFKEGNVLQPVAWSTFNNYKFRAGSIREIANTNGFIIGEPIVD